MENGEEKLDNSLKLIAKSSAVVFIGIFLSKIFSYIYRIVIAREFGPEVYGIFSLAMMVSGIFILFSSMGIGEGLVRYIPLYRGKKQNENIKYLLKKTAKIFLITGFLSVILLLLLSNFISEKIFNEPTLYEFLIVFSFLTPINLFLTLILSTLRSYEKIGLYSLLSNILLTFTNLALIFLFLFLGIGIYAIILSYVLGEFIVLLISFAVIKKQIPEIFQSPKKIKKRKILREVVMYSFPLFLAGIAWKLFKWGDSFIIGFFKTVADVGIYNAASPISLLLAVSSQLFMQLFFPLVTRLYSQGDKTTIKEMTKQVSKWIFILNLPLLLLLIIFPEEILNIFFGEQYLSASSSLIFLSIGVFFLSFFDMSYRLIAMKGMSKILFIDIVVMSITNIILNILLVPKLGILGAAIATMFSYIVLSIIAVYQSRKYLSITPFSKKMLNISLGAAIASIILLFLKSITPQNLLSFIILSIFFLLLYFSLILLFKGFDKNDFVVLNATLKKLKLKRK